MTRQLLAELPWDEGDGDVLAPGVDGAAGHTTFAHADEVLIVTVALIVIVVLMLMLTCYINKLARDISRLNERLDMVEGRNAIQLPLQKRWDSWSIDSAACTKCTKQRAPRFDVQLLPPKPTKDHLKTCMLAVA